jgi:hypothetical protein
MENEVDITDHLKQLIAELDGTEWHASIPPYPRPDCVCLRIERPSPTPGAGTQVMEFCRKSFERAAHSARIHVFKQSLVDGHRAVGHANGR